MTSSESFRFRFHIDRGGTFTDCIGVDAETGERRVVKVLSSDEAPLIGIRRLLELPDGAPVPPCSVRMGTTVATNALLERKGVPTSLLITRGFGDLLSIGNQTRPNIFSLEIEKPQQLYSEVLEVDARCDPRGDVLCRPDPGVVRTALQDAVSRGMKSVAIVVLHAYAGIELELELEEIARDAGFDHTVTSHRAARELGLLKRAQTTVLDAYVTPLLSQYLSHFAEQLPGSEVLLMQSSGVLATVAQFRGPSALLSGPAGGVVACQRLARERGYPSVIGFDMGGTSTDVSRIERDLPMIYEARIANIDVAAPMLSIHTIAAGGGSLCRYDGHTLLVGPESAGADPGPLCYGNPSACELTLTDVNLILGRLQAERFPLPLDLARAQRGLEHLTRRVNLDGHDLSELEVANGLLRIANASMADAVSKVSLGRGHDVRDDALVVFGGAGGQHACPIARLLGIRKIAFHPLSGVLSAHGIGVAQRGFHTQRDIGRPVLDDPSLGESENVLRQLELEARNALQDEDAASVRVHRRIDLKYAETETTLTLDFDPMSTIGPRFVERYRRRFGFVRETHPIVIATVRVDATVEVPQAPESLPPTSSRAPSPTRFTAVHFDGGLEPDVPVYHREHLSPGVALRGPACVLEATGNILVDPGFMLAVQPDGVIELTVEDAHPSTMDASDEDAADPVTLRLMGNAFMAIAEQMGVTLQHTAQSTNIRERLDFSCAVFDNNAELVANAPHIPVHLGAMSESVKLIKERFPNPHVGDVFVSNDPYEGGSHLPDITVVTPVHRQGELLFYTASRGHHSDVGGISPGSMPAWSETLEEEGVLLRAQHLVRQGEFLEKSIRDQLTEARYPARTPDQNIADLGAQVAANALGAKNLMRLMDQQGTRRVLSYVAYVKQDATRWVKEELSRLAEGTFRFTDRLDDGTSLGVTLTVKHEALDVRFEADAEHKGNANAPRAVSVAALMYVLRCLSSSEIPLNAGCLVPVRLFVPRPSLLDPSPGRAVVSGNVETSQRIVDVLLGALGRAAASQGTMNNVTFGGRDFAYYETIGGGSGALPYAHGRDAVQCHMTNTRITDVETLEAKYPVRITRFCLRRGSGGDGKYRGGDGVVRAFQFLEPVEVSVVSERRSTRPYGLAGGEAGQAGINLINGRRMPGRFSARLSPLDELVIETPGGGGYGPAGAGEDAAGDDTDADAATDAPPGAGSAGFG